MILRYCYDAYDSTFFIHGLNNFEDINLAIRILI